MSWPILTQAYGVDDTNTVKKWVSIAYNQQFNAPNTALSYANKALGLSKKINYIKGEASANNAVASVYWIRGDYANALKHFNYVLQSGELLNDQKIIAQAYGNLAVVYIDINDLESAFSYEKKTLTLMSNRHDTKGLAINTNAMGVIYEKTDHFDSALAYYNKAIEYYNVLNDQEWLPLVLSNISSVYTKIGKPEDAITYARKALNMPDSLLDTKTSGHLYINLAKAYIAKGEYKPAIANATRARDISTPEGIKENIRDASEILYLAYKHEHQTFFALKNLETFALYKDSILNIQSLQSINHLRTQVAVEKKNSELLRAKTKLLNSEHIRQRQFLYLVVIILLCLIVAAAISQLVKTLQLKLRSQAQQLDMSEREKFSISQHLNDQLQLNSHLKLEVDLKKQELLSYTLSLAHKNRYLQEITDKIDELPQQTTYKEVRSVKTKITSELESDKNWDEFRFRFEQVHSEFFQKLKAAHPQLSGNDLRMIAFIKLNLSAKQIASLLNIAPSSIDISKYRLKKKLQLAADENLADYIDKF